MKSRDTPKHHMLRCFGGRHQRYYNPRNPPPSSGRHRWGTGGRAAHEGATSNPGGCWAGDLSPSPKPPKKRILFFSPKGPSFSPQLFLQIGCSKLFFPHRGGGVDHRLPVSPPRVRGAAVPRGGPGPRGGHRSPLRRPPRRLPPPRPLAVPPHDQRCRRLLPMETRRGRQGPPGRSPSAPPTPVCA